MVWPNRPHTEEQIEASARRRLMTNVIIMGAPDGIGGGPCRLWICRCDKDGYGQMKHRGKTERAARVAFVIFRGPIPDGKILDHLCRRRPCVNEWHLEPVTDRENLLRGETEAARKAAQTHCINGHAFTRENTYAYSGKRRMCRACAIKRTQERRARNGLHRNSQQGQRL